MKAFATATTWVCPLPKGGFNIQTHLAIVKARSKAAARVTAVKAGKRLFPQYEYSHSNLLEITIIRKEH